MGRSATRSIRGGSRRQRLADAGQGKEKREPEIFRRLPELFLDRRAGTIGTVVRAHRFVLREFLP
jgi:hypothetical protein